MPRYTATHTCTHTQRHTDTSTHTNTDKQPHTHTDTPTHTQIQPHTSDTDTPIHIHTHTQVHSLTPSQYLGLGLCVLLDPLHSHNVALQVGGHPHQPVQRHGHLQEHTDGKTDTRTGSDRYTHTLTVR